MIDNSPSTIALSEVAPGVMLWSRTRGYRGVDDAGDQLEPVGGVVLSVQQTVTEEGELLRVFRTLDPYRTRPTLTIYNLPAGDVNQRTMTAADSFYIVALIRRMAEELCFKKPGVRRGGLFEPRHAEMVADMQRLVAAITGGRTP